MRFSILLTFLFLVKLPINLSGQVADSIDLTSYIQNAIYAEHYELLRQFASKEWHVENYNLEKSRYIHHLAILSIVMDTIPYPNIEESGKIYVLSVITNEYETVQIEGEKEIRLIRPSRLTDWRELGCHWGSYVNWDKELIKEVQKKLITEKWYAGPINGELNKQTLIGFKFYNVLELNHKSHSQYDLIYPNEMVDRSSIYNFLRLDKHVPAFPSYILDLKKALLEKGYNPGELNHKLDDKTKAALTKFQSDQGLPIGSLNFSTLRKLGVKGFRN